LEIELLKTKQELGEALNAVCEYEMNHGADARQGGVNDSNGSGDMSETQRAVTTLMGTMGGTMASGAAAA
jgi:hypothetical protein